ncbi:MAG: energy transducer TonB [Myxococcota bacterium]
MPDKTYQLPTPRGQRGTSLLLGGGFAALLFVVMALVQMIGDVEPPVRDLEENLVAYVPPEIEELEEEPPPIEEEEEPPPEELADEPPQLSLDQLDIALNPGTGGSLAGDFSLPTIGTSARDLGTEDFVDFSDLDQVPRPIGVRAFRFPRRLKKKEVSGEIVLLLRLSEQGEVMDVRIDSSNLEDFDDFVLNEVKGWKFTPPTQQGRPVKAQARFPIPIRIKRG